MRNNKKNKIAYLGPEATFSHQVALDLFDKKNKFVATNTIEEVFECVRDKKCDYGIIPVENSNAGSVNMTMGIFCRKDYKLDIIQEYFSRIDFHFLSQEKNNKNIKLIYAHPMAEAQCRKWLKKNFLKIEIKNVGSNSLAAKLASKEKNTGAISTKLSSNIYNIDLKKENIEDHRDNTTRFLVIGRDKTKPTNNDKTSLLFYLKHIPGSLYKSLSPFAKNNINIIKIESRIMKIPHKSKNPSNWEYHFFLDFEGHIKDKKIKKILEEMKKYCSNLKILGSYPRGKTPW